VSGAPVADAAGKTCLRRSPLPFDALVEAVFLL
jgi:hypothetical protein